MKNLLLLFICFWYTGAFSQDITIENIWKKYEYRSAGVDGFNSLKDGEHYTKIDEQGSIVSYSILNENDPGVVLLNAKNLVWKDERIEVQDYSFNSDETKLLLMTQIESIYRRSYTAIYFLFDLKSKKLEPLSEALQPQTLAEYSPDGTQVSFIHENNIYTKNLTTGKLKALTEDGKRNKVINGTTDWVYEEEFSITKAYAWSPDSKKMAYLRFNEKGVKKFSIDFYGELYPDAFEYKYPKAGEDNSKVTALLVDVKSGKSEKLDLGSYEYIPRIQWSDNSSDLIIQTMNRHQSVLKYHRFDFSPKKLSHSICFQDSSDTYVDVNEKIIFLPSKAGLLLTSERSGYIQLYRVGFDGTQQQITQGKDEVIDVYGLSADGLTIYYSKVNEGGLGKVLCRTELNTNKEQFLSPISGTTDAEFTKGMRYFVGTFSDANTPPMISLFKNDGTLIRVLEDNQVLKSKLKGLSLSPKVFKNWNINGNELNASVIYPDKFDPSQKYPVYMNVYGGPGHNEVSNSWDGNDYMYHQMLAKKGYLIVSVDPRGTQFKGSKFKKSTYMQLGKLETEDIISTAEFLQKEPYVDPKRMGIMGWSYGGFMSSLAITKGADVFKMAIAVAPVTSWRYYDNIYTERFMRTPKENADGYDSNSPINHVDKLKGKYLLIHGSADDNVHVQNTMDMISALVKANKSFDQFIYPNKNHGIYGGNTRNHLFSMMYDYILKNL